METLRAKIGQLPGFTVDLGDLVRGIRANKKNESKYISEQLQAIRDELKSANVEKKVNGVLKLTYLEMLGYDMSWASFNVVEVMCCPRFGFKRVGYLAANQSFTDSTDVLMLATNLIRKDFSTKNFYEAALALNCISNVCTHDLGRDLAADVVTLLTSSKPYIRKRAVLTLYKIFLKYPDALRPAFPRLKERLKDDDPSVVCATVNVLCELARKNPRNYLPLASVFFELLSAPVANNWMLIKIIKLFGVLTPLEPRLARLLVQPMHNLMTATPAMSLLYECIQTCVAGLSAHLPTMKLCIQKLRAFIEDADPNLKYLGLTALNSIMKIHPRAVAEHGDIILRCLEDDDNTIRSRALELLDGIVSRRNIVDIVARLIILINRLDGPFRDEILSKVVSLCHANQYANVTDFEWYLSVLTDLSRVPGTKRGGLLATQFLDVAIRVMEVRPFAARVMVSFLRDPRFSVSPVEGGICEILDAASWILAEFYRETVIEVAPLEVLELLLQTRIAQFPARIQATFMQNALKFFAKMSSGDLAIKPPPKDEDEDDEDGEEGEKGEEEEEDVVLEPVKEEVLIAASQLMLNRLPLFAHSTHVEVQERACLALEISKLFVTLKEKGVDMGAELFNLFDEPLLPVSKSAQRKVPVPEGLDLDTPICAVADEEGEDEDEDEGDLLDGGGDFTVQSDDLKVLREMGENSQFSSQRSPAEDKAAARMRRRRRQMNSPFYIGGDEDSEEEEGGGEGEGGKGAVSVENIPVEQINEDLGKLRVDEQPTSFKKAGSSRRGPQGKKPRAYKVRKFADGEDDEEDGGNGVGEEGMKKSGRGKGKENDDALASISLDDPLRPDEALPVTQAYSARIASSSVSSEDLEKKRRGEGEGAGKKPFYLRESGGGSSSSSGDTKPVLPEGFRAMCADYLLQMGCKYETNAKEPGKVMVHVAFCNMTKSEMVAHISVEVPDNDKACLVHNPRFEKPAIALKPGQSAVHKLLFVVKDLNGGFSITGTFHYEHKKQRGPVGSKDVPFHLAFPAALFVEPAEITKEALAQIIKGAGSSLVAVTVPVQVPKRSGAAAELIDTISREVVHVAGVLGTSGRSLYYGKTRGSGVHVAMMARDKVQSEGIVSFELKCGTKEVADSLAESIKSFHM